MADKDQADDEAAEAAPAAPKGKLKLIIIAAAAGVLLILGGGAGWFFLFRHHGEEVHAEAPPPKPPVFVEVPDMLVNLVGAPGERVQYLKVKVVLEVKEEKQAEASSRRCRGSPISFRPICASCGRATSTVPRACFA